MGRLRLSTLLISINVGLLLAAVVGVAFIAVRFLRQLADDQALARVTQAGLSAQNAIARSGQNVLTSAQLLSERPTLLRLIQADDTDSLAAFLTQFQETSQLDGSGVLLNDKIVAQSGVRLDWSTIWAAHRQDKDYFLHAPLSGGPLILAAWAPISSRSGGAVLVAVQLDEAFAGQVSTEVGLPVRVLPLHETQASSPLTVLRMQVLTSSTPVTTRLTDPDRYLAIMPLRGPTSNVAGIIETELSGTAINRSLSKFVQTLLLLALGVAFAAALVSLYLGRRLSLPLQSLTTAAARIGRGDLMTPISAASGLEIGTLSATLEEMRRRLLQLTANLRRQQTESNSIVTGIVEGVFTVDRERRIQYLNPQATTMIGIAAEAAVSRFCGDVLGPQGENGIRPCEEQCPIIHARFRTGARATEHLLLPDGQRRTVVITSAPPTEDPALSSGFAGVALETGFRQIQVMRDETEEEATRRLRDAVLANISHEFKTPLSAQLASIELLLDQLPDLTTGQIADLVVSLQRGTLRLTQLIDNLLESVRIEAGRFAIRNRPVSLDEVIEQALEMTRPLIDQRQQQVIVNLPYPLPPIAGDAPRLTQVFVNLLANANKFSPVGSILHLRGTVDADTITISIEDQGPGLPASDDTLFVPFVRSLADEPETGGVGLGLWIVKSIVERHNGHVEVHNGPAGAIVSVTFPRDLTNENSDR